MDITTLSLKEDRGPYNYRPQRPIDATEYKWQFEDIKPLTTSSTPLQFRIDDRPYPFCPREMELHLKVKFKLADPKRQPITTPPPNSSLDPSITLGTVASVKCVAKSTMPRLNLLRG